MVAKVKLYIYIERERVSIPWQATRPRHIDSLSRTCKKIEWEFSSNGHE
jgi:hypothetical protein